MMLFAVGIERSFGAAIQCPHDSDTREHRNAASRLEQLGAGRHADPHAALDTGALMSRHKYESWKIIGAFMIVCALLTALIIVL